MKQPTIDQINSKIADMLEINVCRCKTPQLSAENEEICWDCIGNLVSQLKWCNYYSSSRALPIMGTVEEAGKYTALLKRANEYLSQPEDVRFHPSVEALAWILYKGWEWAGDKWVRND